MRLTRARFILLWGVGVVFFFLISWKHFFKADEKVPNSQYDWRSSHDNMKPGANAKQIGEKARDHQAMGPPSAVLNAMKPNVDTHHDVNIIDFGGSDIGNGVRPPVDPRPDAKFPNRLNHNSFLAVPHQETDDDGKSSSRDGDPDEEDSSSDSSDLQNPNVQDAEEGVMKRENLAKAVLFDEENPFTLPNSHLHQDQETNQVALATVKLPVKESYEKTIHQPQFALSVPESREDDLSPQKQNPPKPPQDSQTLPKSINVDRNDGRIDKLHQVQNYSPPGNVPQDRFTNEVSQDTATSSDSSLLKDRARYPPEDVSRDEVDKQRQVVPSGVLHKEKTDVVATAAAREIPIDGDPVESQQPRPRFAEGDTQASQGELKQLAPATLPDGERDEVATDTERHNEERIPHPLDVSRDESVVVAEKPLGDGNAQLGKASDRLERENVRVDALKISNDSDLQADTKLPDVQVAKSDSRQSNVIFNQAARDLDTARRNRWGNLPSKISIHSDAGRPAPPNAAVPRNGLVFKQLQMPVVSGQIKAVSHETGQTEKAVPPESETEEQFMQRMEAVQRARHDRVRQQCQSRYHLTPLDFQRDRQKILSWKKYYEHAYANDDHQFIICRELKAASFSWRTVMRSLYVKGSPQFRRSQKMGDFPMMDYDDQTFLSKLQNYKKILFIREPFARLLSAYRDKYVELRHFPYYQPIGRNIIRKYRKNPSFAEIQSGRPSFEEFTRWVVTEEVPEGDYHWRPLFNWYHPCQITYDFIGKVETATEDAKYIFKMIGIDKLETFPSTETHHKFSSSTDILQEFYSQLPPDLLPRLVDRYKEEFELFDYPIPEKMSDIWTKR